jgi:hypothetical protein
VDIDAVKQRPADLAQVALDHAGGCNNTRAWCRHRSRIALIVPIPAFSRGRCEAQWRTRRSLPAPLSARRW